MVNPCIADFTGVTRTQHLKVLANHNVLQKAEVGALILLISQWLCQCVSPENVLLSKNRSISVRDGIGGPCKVYFNDTSAAGVLSCLIEGLTPQELK